MLTEKERILLLMYRGFGDRVRSYQEVADLFNAEHPDRNPISKSTVQKTVIRFFEAGTVKDRPRSGRPKSATNDDKSLDVLQSFQENPHLSVSRAAQAHDISESSVFNILQRQKYHPYKIIIAQELMEDDFDRRIQFCEEMMRRIDEGNFLNFVVFSDEAMFEINGAVNRHNCRYWSDENPHWMSDLRTQYPQKLNVWAGICSCGIIGPFFINGNLTAEKYENLLRDHVIPNIENLFDADMQNVWFQQDGAGPHYAIRIREFLNRSFPDRWIGRRGAIEWPARSPDLTPLDYFLWGHLKSKVYATKPHDLEDLRNRIMNEASLITLEQISNVMNNFYERLAHCQTVEGRHFEHLIN